MKTRDELEDVIQRIAKADSPVGMDAVYVHALILDKLEQIQQRLDRIEQTDRPGQQQPRQ
jgi:hypothetical protein